LPTRRHNQYVVYRQSTSLALGLTISIRRVRQKRDMTRALDGGRQQPLMLGAIAGHSAWNDFAALQHEPAQQLVVLVINSCDLVFAQTAWFPSSSIKSFSHDSLSPEIRFQIYASSVDQPLSIDWVGGIVI
jgi:hypothetical protein